MHKHPGFFLPINLFGAIVDLELTTTRLDPHCGRGQKSCKGLVRQKLDMRYGRRARIVESEFLPPPPDDY